MVLLWLQCGYYCVARCCLLFGCYGVARVFLGGYFGVARWLLCFWVCNGVAMVLLWVLLGGCYGVARCCYGVARCVSRCCYGVAARCCYGVARWLLGWLLWCVLGGC